MGGLQAGFEYIAETMEILNEENDSSLFIQ